jgi:hypothetical protein
MHKRLTMLRLARRPPHNQTRDGTIGARVCDDAESSEASQDGHQDELEETWKQPEHTGLLWELPPASDTCKTMSIHIVLESVLRERNASKLRITLRHLL